MHGEGVCRMHGEGVCRMHGEGAKRMWKPFWKEVVENDVVTRVYSRKIVYICVTKIKDWQETKTTEVNL